MPRKKHLEGELLRWLQNPNNWSGPTKNRVDCNPNVKRERKNTLNETVERLGDGATVDEYDIKGGQAGSTIRRWFAQRYSRPTKEVSPVQG